MDIDEPCSPDSTPRTSPLVCPPAPRKPSLARDTSSAHKFLETGLEAAREAILELGESERGRVLPSLPRHALEPLLAAYCEWCSCTCPEPFQDLATLVPDLDFQIYQQACTAFPDLSWGSWSECCQLAASDAALRHRVASGLAQSLSEPARRGLHFG